MFKNYYWSYFLLRAFHEFRAVFGRTPFSRSENIILFVSDTTSEWLEAGARVLEMINPIIYYVCRRPITVTKW